MHQEDVVPIDHPQPIGIFPLPAGYLVLPAVGSAAQHAWTAADETLAKECLAKLMAGHVPERMPEPWRFFAEALEGKLDEARARLEADPSPVARYNRFILQADAESYLLLQAQLTGELRIMLDVAAFTMGYAADPAATTDASGEVAAAALMAKAAYHLERNENEPAIRALTEAVQRAEPVSPLFAAQLYLSLAAAHRANGGAGAYAVTLYRRALSVLEPSNLLEVRGEAWLNLGMLYQELAGNQREPLLEAARCYLSALRLFEKERHPEAYALGHMNLALTYLATPMQEARDQLRMAVAVQSLREALKVFHQESHPELWATAQLNLANALQYLPSSHPEENLIEAVQLYEEILNVRRSDHDPLGYARVLANQANALAHLGILSHAQTKLGEAAALFEKFGEVDAAETARSMLQEIAEQLLVSSQPAA